MKMRITSQNTPRNTNPLCVISSVKLEISPANHNGWTVILLLLLTMTSFSELRHLSRAQDGQKDPRKQMADRRSHSRDLLCFIGNNKTWYKKCFLGVAGAQHARPGPGLLDYSLYRLKSQCRCLRLVSVLSIVKQLLVPLYFWIYSIYLK